VVAYRQLIALGLKPSAIQRLVAAGRVLRLHPGVYAVGHNALSRQGRWMAAVLAYGPGAVLSHRDAAMLFGLRDSARAAIDVTAPGRSRHVRPGITVHRPRRLDPRDCTQHRGVPVTTVARILLDLAEVLPLRQVRYALEESQRQRLFDLRAVEELLERSPGRRGVKPLASLLAEQIEPPDVRSMLERSFVDLYRALGLPEPQLNVRIGPYVVDVLWPERRLVVELDGRETHLTIKAFEDDRIRDADLQARFGYVVLRITYRRLVTRPDDVRALLLDAYGASDRSALQVAS
jgi:predicted transcriptional regulator of viral defense system